MSTFKNNHGFTLIETIVAVGIFAIVMVIASGAVINAVDANRKAQSLNVVVNNLNLAIESMVRDIRTGSDYTDVGCGSANSCIKFTDRNGNRNVEYSYIVSGTDKYIEKSKTGGQTINGLGRITSEEVVIEEATFELQGKGKDGQPERILIHIKGYAGENKTKSEFNIQTLVTSRTLDATDL